MKLSSLGGVFLSTALMVAPVQAGVTFQTGNNPQSLEENVLFNGLGLISTGNPVSGKTDQTGTLVFFSSDEILTTPSQGQARVEAVDGSFMTYTLSGFLFHDYIFNLNIVHGAGTGTASIMATLSGGSSASANFPISANGQNFFTVFTTGADLLRQVQVTTTIPIQDVRENRVSGIVPEPGSWALLGSGFLALGALVRRKLSV